MRILTAAQIREVDRLTTERYKIPSLLLMENAAARTAEAVEHAFGPAEGRYVKVFCGKGNNGGDGAAIARQLWMRGALVDVLLLGRLDEGRRGDSPRHRLVIAGSRKFSRTLPSETSTLVGRCIPAGL